jgi:putative hydroxymethylpyrimidine transport system permease protein
MTNLLRGTFVIVSLFILWELLTLIFNFPIYILPSPFVVLHALFTHASLIVSQAWITILETLLGLLLGTLVGASLALTMIFFQPLRLWLMPMLILSQALPVFAIAPILVIWLGYGIASKIVVIILMLFFPVASSFFDGLKSTNPNFLDLAQTMNATRWNIVWKIRVPAALPSLASGIRVATAAAPLGAIIGEWVGSSSGLGFLMLNANARLQIDLMFAVLLVVIAFGIILFFTVDKLLRVAIPWQKM